MKKAILSLFCVGLFSGAHFSAMAQVEKSFYKTPYKSRNNGTFDRSSNIISLGYGFGYANYMAPGWVSWGNDRFSYGPAYLKYEHGIIDEIGIGVYAGLAGYRVKHGPGNRFVDKASTFGSGVLGYYHFNKIIPVRGLDVYAGMGIGFTNTNYMYDGGRPRRGDYTDFRVIGVFKGGVRYYFTPGFGVYAEGGYDDMSSVNLGLSFRF